MEKINIIALGSSNLLFKCAQLVKDYYKDSATITIIDTAYSPIKHTATKDFDIKYLSSKMEIFEYLDSIDQHTFLLSINNPYLIPAKYTDSDLFTMINLHHALLPNHPGRNAEAWAIFEEDDFAGITWHYISSGVDTGDIILSRPVKIASNMTSLKLLKECERAAIESFPLLLPFESLQRGNASPQPHHTSAPKKAHDAPNNGYLNLGNDWSIYKKYAFLRSLDYGILEVLGKPKCVWQNKEFYISKYSFKECLTNKNEVSFEETPSGFKITITKDNKELVVLLK